MKVMISQPMRGKKRKCGRNVPGEKKAAGKSFFSRESGLSGI